MKTVDHELELKAVLTIVVNNEKGNDRIALRMLGELSDDHFGYEPTQELFHRLRRLTRKGKAIPSLSALRSDARLSEEARILLPDAIPHKSEGAYLRKESDLPSLIESLHAYYQVRTMKAHGKAAFKELKEAEGIHTLDFDKLVGSYEAALNKLKRKTETKQTLLHAGLQSNSMDLTDKILSDEGDYETIKLGFDSFDIPSGGLRKGQLLVLASHRKGGKCAAAGTLIETERGLIPIETLFDGTDPEDTFVPTKIKLAHRYGVTETSQRYTKMHDSSVRILSDRGFEFEGSKVHPVLVFDPKTLVLDYKKMEDLRKGDFLVLNTKHHVFPTKPFKIGWKYQPTKYDLGVEISCAHCDYKGAGLSVHLTKAHPRVNRAAYLRKHHPEYTRWPQNRRDYAATARKVPSHMTEDLAKVLGYLVAEGSSSRVLSYTGFHQSDKGVFKDFCDAFKRCFPDTLLQIKRGACNVAMIRSSYVCKYLQHLGMVFSHSREKDVPWSILRSTRECVQAFLRAYYEGDGGVEKGRIIAASSASEKLLKNIQQLLLRFSIVSQRSSRMKCATNGTKIKRLYHTLAVTKHHADTFMREIGFVSKRKNSAIEPGVCTRSDAVPMVTQLANKLKAKHAIPGSQGFYRLPNGERKKMVLQAQDSNDCTVDFLTRKRPELLDSIAHYEPKFVEGIREVLEQGFVLDPIVEIKRSSKPVRLYDLSVPASHSYVANGMVVHNSITALNMAYNQYWNQKLSTCIIPLEMNQEEVRMRLLSKLTAIPFERFYKRVLDNKERKLARKMWEKFEQHGIDNGCRFSTWKPERATVDEIVFQLKPYRYDVIVVDYVNLLSPPVADKNSRNQASAGSNDWQMLSQFYKQLKEAASTLDCLMVGLTQTNTEGGIKYSSAALEDCDCAVTWKFLEAEQASHMLRAKVEVARNFAPFEFLLTEDYAHMNVTSYAAGGDAQRLPSRSGSSGATDDII